MTKVSCKCNCIYQDNNECNRDGILINQLGCLSYIQKEDDVYATVLKYYGDDIQIDKAISELNELIEAIDCGDPRDIAQEMSDCYNTFEYVKEVYNIENEELGNIMTAKMNRTLERIKKEDNDD